MTREEAIRTLSFHMMQCGAMMPIELVRKNGEGSELMKAFRMAMDALREQGGKDTNVRTEADRIRSMSNEELAELLVYESVEYTVDYDYDENPIDDYTPCWRTSDGSIFWGYEAAVEFELAWLQQPAKEDA